jgi:hypothetical protein
MRLKHLLRIEIKVSDKHLLLVRQIKGSSQITRRINTGAAGNPLNFSKRGLVEAPRVFEQCPLPFVLEFS